MCDDINVDEVATFDNGYPPIIIANIEPNSRRSEEGYGPNPVRFRDMKRQIKIGSVKYAIISLSVSFSFDYPIQIAPWNLTFLKIPLLILLFSKDSS